MRQHSTLSMTPCGSRNKPTVDVVSAAACEFLAGRCSSSGVGRPARRDETVWTPLDLQREKAAGRTACPGGPREDLVCRRMDVD